jgi:hypothetical protein
MWSLRLHYGPGVTSALTEMSARNLSGGKKRPARKADSLTATFEPIVYKMWEPPCLTTLWAFRACYRDIFTLLFTMKTHMGVEVHLHHSGPRDEWSWIGGTVGPRGCLDAVEYRRISFPYRESNSSRPVATRFYTDWAIQLQVLHVSFIYFICSLLNDAVRNSELITSNERMRVNNELGRMRKETAVVLLGETEEYQAEIWAEHLLNTDR